MASMFERVCDGKPTFARHPNANGTVTVFLQLARVVVTNSFGASVLLAQAALRASQFLKGPETVSATQDQP